MASPLSSRSLAVHNRARTLSSEGGKVIGENSYFGSKDLGSFPPSSPFQLDIDQENNAPDQIMPQWSSPSPVRSLHTHSDDRVVATEEATMTLDLGIYPVQIDHHSVDAAPNGGSLLEDALHHALPAVGHTWNSIDKDDLDTLTVVSDDTCFSTFSAIPNADMTVFANTGNIKTSLRPEQALGDASGPHSQSKQSQTVELGRSPSPTPMPGLFKQHANENTTNLLLDFTRQFEDFQKPQRHSPTKSNRLAPVRVNADSTLLSYIQNQRAPSPSKTIPVTPRNDHRNSLHLLDFDLPPQPTPRSIPTITAREIESVKSGYLSEISSLKASLSGREAEVQSLKTAVGDAERRVGEALETLREERSAREQASLDKAEWENKGRDLEALLQSIRVEVGNAAREREDIQQRLDECRRALDEAHSNAEKTRPEPVVSCLASNVIASSANTEALEALVVERVGQQLDEKMENLARELHAIYKKKHETKVATLKKTYELRGEKRCTELQSRLDELTTRYRLLADLKGVEPPDEPLQAALQQQTACVVDLKGQLAALTYYQAELEQNLERERAEKGDLVAAVDEMLSLQSGMNQGARPGSAGGTTDVDEIRRSSGAQRTPGLRAPYAPASRIGRVLAPAIAKSRMMSSIERMGSGRAAE